MLKVPNFSRSLLGWIALPAICSVSTSVCAQVTHQSFFSPHRKYVIEAVVRDPGGVGAPQTVVSMHRSRNKLSTYKDNILVVDGAHTIAVQWQPGDSLAVVITCEGCNLEGAMLTVTRFEDIGIRYEAHAPEPAPTAKENKPPAS